MPTSGRTRVPAGATVIPGSNLSGSWHWGSDSSPLLMYQEGDTLTFVFHSSDGHAYLFMGQYTAPNSVRGRLVLRQANGCTRVHTYTLALVNANALVGEYVVTSDDCAPAMVGGRGGGQPFARTR